MSDDLIRFGALIDRIYQGALEPELWPGVMAELAGWMDASKVSLFTLTLAHSQGGFTYDHGLSPALYDAWQTYQPNDLYTQKAYELGLVVVGNVIVGEELVPQSQLLTSAYYHDFLKIDDIPQLLTGMVIDERDSCFPATVCALYRGRKHPSFTEADRSRYRLLMPHLIRAVGTMFRLRALEGQAAAGLAALDGLTEAVLLADGEGEIVFANRAALLLLAEGDGLRLKPLPGGRRWRLCAAHTASQKGIDALLRRASDCRPTDDASVQPLRVPRPSRRAAYALTVSALPRRHGFGSFAGGPRSMLFVTDTTRPLALDAATLMPLYGLTRREAALAVALGEGIELKEAAEALGVTLNTAKTQLAQVYQKTGVDNRARLTKLLAALAAGGHRGME